MLTSLNGRPMTSQSLRIDGSLDTSSTVDLLHPCTLSMGTSSTLRRLGTQCDAAPSRSNPTAPSRHSSLPSRSTSSITFNGSLVHPLHLEQHDFDFGCAHGLSHVNTWAQCPRFTRRSTGVARSCSLMRRMRWVARCICLSRPRRPMPPPVEHGADGTSAAVLASSSPSLTTSPVLAEPSNVTLIPNSSASVPLTAQTSSHES
ncbi:hypothetical protein CVT26_015062 [Gymnopilus dilepis]|uniref:Uncharacterized protein n=1 Tax=Gymnopilus dilepis TaxID=231916 RepID=A0A409W424_9AGAR|nr:hypothetical protein CVT26_015062 [Gymnopilus dilepis]